jgi:hypothetical protein
MSIQTEQFDDNKKYPRSSVADKEGGICIPDEDNTVGLMIEVFKKMGKKLGEGGGFDLASIPKPVRVCSNISYLENLSYDFAYCSPYISTAAKTTDPVQRMKYLIPFLLGTVCNSIKRNKNKGPFESLVGETFFARRKDGTEIYCEQTVRAPPTMLFSIYGPNNLYKAHGWGMLKAEAGVNSMEGTRAGKTTVYFNDGTDVQITFPSIQINGLFVGRKNLNICKKPFLVDKKNGILTEIYFNHDNKDAIVEYGKKFKKPWLANAGDKLSDFYAIVINKYQKLPSGEVKKDPIAFGCGSWLEYIQVEGEVIWRSDDAVDDWDVEPEEEMIPSHSRLRLDGKLIMAQDLEKAGVEKDRLMDQDIADEKNRASKKKN